MVAGGRRGYLGVTTEDGGDDVLHEASCVCSRTRLLLGLIQVCYHADEHVCAHAHVAVHVLAAQTAPPHRLAMQR